MSYIKFCTFNFHTWKKVLVHYFNYHIYLFLLIQQINKQLCARHYFWHSESIVNRIGKIRFLVFAFFILQ